MAVTPPSSGPSQAAGVSAGALLGARYRLDELLASGGMAQVWLGTDEVLRRAIAVKILHQHLAADQTFVTRFRHEAIAVARLSHPSIVNVYDTCSDDGVEAIVMELVRGETLRTRLDDGQMDPWVAANIAAQVAGALSVAHAAGLVHRDIKPANILLSEDGRVKVGDFGIAKAAESADLTQEGSFLGTAKYLAPEQVEAKPVDGRTDLYSLGVVLYEMLCGRVPFEADTSSSTALARLHSDPPRPRLVKAGVPRELEAITMRLLARDPAGRYPTATDARAALLGAGADDQPTVGHDERRTAHRRRPAAPSPASRRGHGRHRRRTARRPARAPARPRRPARPPRGSPTASAGGWSPPSWWSSSRWPSAWPGCSCRAPGDGIFGGDDGDDHARRDPAGRADHGHHRPLDRLRPRRATARSTPTRRRPATPSTATPSTSWSSESLQRRPSGAGSRTASASSSSSTRPGPISAVEFDTPLSGWQAEVYVADSPQGHARGLGRARRHVRHQRQRHQHGRASRPRAAPCCCGSPEASDSDSQVTVDEVRILR